MEGAREKSKGSSGLVGKLVSAAAGITLGLASLLMPSRADAATININSSQSVATINSTIAGANPGIDTINFTKGTYQQTDAEDAYNLKPNLNYTFSNVTINGSGGEDYRIFRIVDGGDMTLSGSLTLQNVLDGFYIGGTVYDNIDISGVTFNVSRNGILYSNVIHASQLTQAAIDVHHNVANGGERLIGYYEAGGTTAYSPYASARNNSVRDLLVFMMDVPVADIPGGSLHNLGEDEISNNILIRSLALSEPENYQYYHSPNDNGYKDVTYPFTGGTGNIFLTEADFYDYANLIPLAGGPADLGNVGDEIYMGAIKPVPEPATLISLGLLGLGASLLRRKRSNRKLEEITRQRD